MSQSGEANRWLRAQGDPDSFLSRADIGRRDETYRTQLGYAASRLAIGNPLAAWRHWSRLRKDMDFTRELERSVARQVALWAARRDIATTEKFYGATRAAQSAAAGLLASEVKLTSLPEVPCR